MSITPDGAGSDPAPKPKLKTTPARPKEHKLGWKSRDLTELRREHAEKLDLIISRMLDRFRDGLDEIPVRMLAIPIGILMDKRQALDQVPSLSSTQNNTVVINGFSRGDAMAFLTGAKAEAKAGDGLHTIGNANDNAIDLAPAQVVAVATPAVMIRDQP